MVAIPTPLQIINREFEVYVAVVLPKKVGGRDVKYQVCRKENDKEDCSEEDIVTTFNIEIARNRSEDIAINSDGFEIKESLFLPHSWKLSEPTEAISTWTRIQVLEGDDLVPSQAPPFFVYRFKSDLEKVAHLPVGVQREQYGDLLDDYSVRSYCGTYDLEDLSNGSGSYDLSWNLGHPSICTNEQTFDLFQKML